jgi:hypothetical protein
MSTIRDLQTCDLDERSNVAMLMSGTYLEAFQRLGSWESVLDLVITTVAWKDVLIGVPARFVSPITPLSLEHLQSLLRVRYGRLSGIARRHSEENLSLWDAIGGRCGIDLEGRWTLEQCGDRLGVTRERFRQIEASIIWEPRFRRWPCRELLDSVLDAINGSSSLDVVSLSDSSGSTYESVESEQIRYLARLVGLGDDPRATAVPTPTELFAPAGISPRELSDVAFLLSERIGFVQLVDLEMRIAQRLGGDFSHLVPEAVKLVCTFPDLPHGFVYVDGNRNSFTFNVMQSLLSLLGPLRVSEAHEACRRNSIYRAGAGYPFPPLSVFREWLSRDSRFELQGEEVNIRNRIEVDLGKIQGWMKDVIEDSAGSVIHRTMLYELGRRAGVRPGTLNVYCSFNAYFKPAGSNCITLTGREPTSDDIQVAHARAAQYKVKNDFLGYSLESGVLKVQVTVGTEMIDSGLFGFPAVVRRLLGDTKYQAIFDGIQHGHIAISGVTSIGFSTTLTEMSIVPGDQVEIFFDLQNATATFNYLTLKNVDLD